MSKLSIGIDLGTTHSCVGVYKKNGIVDIISNEVSSKTTPSYVSFTENERYIGNTAKDMVGRNPKNTVYDAKRLIGNKFSDKKIQNELKNYSFNVESDENDKPVIVVDYLNEKKKFHPEQISAMILEKMKNIAETFTNEKITDVVVTVPAYFNDAQRQATKDAGQIAGLNILRIINEPTAAALAYGLDKKEDRTILVFDLGGGTLDVTILNMNDGIFTVKSTCGDTHLGGEDFDNKLKDYCLLKFSDKHILKKKLNDFEKEELCSLLNIQNMSQILNLKSSFLKKIDSENENINEYLEQLFEVIKLQENVKLMRRLKTACENAKKSLSTSNSINVNYDNFYDGEDLGISITKSKFESLCQNEFKSCLDPVDQAIKDANISYNSIDDVVLIGGSTRIPKIQELLNEKFPNKLKSDINPDEAVAYGATIQAAIINQTNDDVTNKIVLVDVTPLSLGIETAGGVMEKMIDRNTPLPINIKKTFSTYSDNQPCVTIKIFEGERNLTKYNNLLGKFNLENVPPMRRGEPKIEVSFDVDINGIMKIQASETTSGNENNITIKNDKNRLSKQDICKMIDDAEKFNEKDLEISEKINAKINIENYVDLIKHKISDPSFQEYYNKEKCSNFTEKLDKITDWLENDVSKDEMDFQYKKLIEEFSPIIENLSNKNKINITS